MRRALLLSSIAGGLLLGGALWVMRPDVGSRTPQAPPVAGAVRRQVKVQVNLASRDELMRVPGVSAQLADRIIQHRPYRKLDDLVSRKVLGKKEFAIIRDYLEIRRTP